MELSPGEPESLVPPQIAARVVDRAQATTIEHQAHVFDGDDLAAQQRITRRRHVKRNGDAGRCDHTEYVLLHRQPGIHVADGEDRATRVTIVAEVEVAPESEAFGEDRGPRMGR